MDHLEDVTIMFSDLKGYTEWCSKHEPMEVYRVLNKVIAQLFSYTDESFLTHMKTLTTLTQAYSMQALTHCM
jgi:Adenylate and Guanylate cyclase catalytic domain